MIDGQNIWRKNMIEVKGYRNKSTIMVGKLKKFFFINDACRQKKSGQRFGQ